MDLGLASLSNSQIFELLQETLLVLASRSKDAYMLETSQALIKRQGELLKAAKQEFYQLVEQEFNRQVQEVKEQVWKKFLKWAPTMTFLTKEDKQELIDAEYNRLAELERADEARKTINYVHSHFQQMLQEEDLLTESEDIKIAASIAVKLVREKRDELKKLAATKTPGYNSSRDVLQRLAQCIGNPVPLNLNLQVNYKYEVVGAVIECPHNLLGSEFLITYNPASNIVIKITNPTAQAFNYTQNYTQEPSWKVKGRAKEVRILLEEYIEKCADSSKLFDVIPICVVSNTDQCTCGHSRFYHDEDRVCREYTCTCKHFDLSPLQTYKTYE